METTIVFFVSMFGPVLWKVFETLLEKGKDVALDKGFEPLKKLVNDKYDEIKDSEALSQAVLATLDELKKDKAFDSYDQLLATLKLTGLTDKAKLALAGVAVEMTQFSPSVISADLLGMLNLGEDKRDLLARFLFELRNQLKNKERFKVGIQYANDMDGLGVLRGISRDMLFVADRLSVLAGYEEAIVKERRLTTDDAQALRDYLAEARQKWEGLMLPFLQKKSGGVANAKLKQVFVPLNLRDIRAEEESSRKEGKASARPEKTPNEEEAKKTKPVDIGELLNRYPKFILIGDPGCGKTTLLSRVALAFAEGRALDDLGWQGKNLFPIFMRLRNFGAFLKERRAEYFEPSAGALIAYFENQCRVEQRITLTPDFFDKRLMEGDCIVLMDGLDEVSDLRSEVAMFVDAFAERYVKKGNIIGMASRPKGYELVEMQLRRVGLAVAEVNPLDFQGIRQLMENLLKFIELDAACRATDLDKLTRAVRSSEELTRIAGTPLFCAALVQVFKYYGVELPKRRVDVFDEIVALLLGHWHAQQKISDPNQLAMDDGTGRVYGELRNAVLIKQKRLNKLALYMQETHQAEITETEATAVLYEYLKSGKERGVPKDDDVVYLWAENFLRNSHERSGLLVERDPEARIYSFLHKGFMEYLAASALTQLNDSFFIDFLLALVKDKEKFEWWEQVILLAGAHPNTTEYMREELIDRLLKQAETYANDSEERLRHLILAGKLAYDIGELLSDAQYKQVENVLRETATASTLPPVFRASAADALDELGFVPDDLYEFVPVGQIANLTYLACHPVTNLQYKRFLDAPDFADEKYWIDFPKYDSDEKNSPKKETWGRAGYEWLQEFLKRDEDTDGKVAFPRYWNDPRFGLSRRTAPVVGVTWYEANAYCKWLTANWQTQLEAQSNSTFLIPNSSLRQGSGQAFSFRLPTEKEWLTAAGGLGEPIIIGKNKNGEDIKRYRFPWDKAGEVTPEPTSKDDEIMQDILRRANIDQVINRTTPAGMYPLGKVNGLWDMAGNVWEWQANYSGDEYVGQKALALRGGSWYTSQNSVRVSGRRSDHPDAVWNLKPGFRVLFAPPTNLL